jgi:hypothetical protein
MQSGASYCNPLTQRVLKDPSCTLLHVGKHVGIGIQGYGYSGVSQHLGDDLGVDVPAQQQRRARVPKVVEPDGGKYGLLEEEREGPLPKIGRVHERAPLCSEDESLVLVKVAEALHLLPLAREVLLEGLHCRLG